MTDTAVSRGSAVSAAPGDSGVSAAPAQENAHGLETPIVIGTAGHVDHGKSSLVLRLTGTDPDRLPQEKSRGITIELGFVELALPSGRIVGLVDVPGHEHFVRAMIAGATGVDIALLVIAADDGVMPQTREHLRILELLGVKQLVVALTKIDLVSDPDWLEMVKADTADFLQTTRFAGAPVIGFSARTGEGTGELRQELDRQVQLFLQTGVVERRALLPGRLPVDRVFSISGAGTVVTGTTSSGVFHTGDEVEIVPAGVRARIRTIQVHNNTVDSAVAGQRTALNLVGAPEGSLERGCTIAEPQTLRAHDRFDARIRWLGREESPEALESGERVHVCTKTSQTVGRVLLFNGQQSLPAGGESFVQIRLDEPLVLRAHDRFVLMSYSPVDLVAGGEILLTGPARRSRLSEAEMELLSYTAAGKTDAAVRAFVLAAPAPVSVADAVNALDIPAKNVQAALDACAQDAAAQGADGQQGTGGSGTAQDAEQAAGGSTQQSTDAAVLRLPARTGLAAHYLSSELLASLTDNMVQELEAQPQDSWGASARSLRDATAARIDEETFAALVDAAVARGQLVRFGAALTTPGRARALEARSAGLFETLQGLIAKHGLQLPLVDELSVEAGIPVAELQRGLRGLEERGQAVQIGKNQYLGTAAIDEARALITQTVQAQPDGRATASVLRDALGLSRKYAVPVLEYFDRVGLTVRNPADPNYRKLK